MINVNGKITTKRVATAVAKISMAPETLARLEANDLPKKDVLPIARAAGVMAAKKTPEMIPYCHNLPIEGVSIEFQSGSDHIVVWATVTAIWRTGVEMEALVAATMAVLTIYDMLKPVDKNLEVSNIRLEEKSGGKSDFVEKLPSGFRASVIVTSDGTYAGKREDKSGKIICDRLRQFGITTLDYTILPDEEEIIRNRLLQDCEQKVNLIITTGGTGLGPRDVTVEATAQVIERDMPAVMQALRLYGQERTPYAMLSRGLAGVRGKTVILNLPGSSRGIEEGLEAVFPALFHVFKMMRGGSH